MNKIRISRAIWPVLLGIGVIAYLFWKQFDIHEFRKMEWSYVTVLVILLSCLILVAHHLAYSYRLWVLAEGKFSFLKCIQLMFIWEFSSAIAPTAVGGSAVALFALSQEKLSAAKTSVIVIYTVILDSYFFVITLPLLYLIFGPEMIYPELKSFDLSQVVVSALFTAFIFKIIYSTLFLYGLFFNPRQIKRLLVALTSVGFLRRWRRKAIEFGDEIILASKNIKGKPVSYHLKVILTTMVAWVARFMVLVVLILGIIGGLEKGPWIVCELYARVETMFMTIMFSPSPGGAGIIELVFGGFLSDYVPKGISLIVATIWRLVTYYSYLIAGVIIVPNWLNKILRDRALKKKSDSPDIE
jgi:uncharacterized membrane protein YbhN (UPF0104 family)